MASIEKRPRGRSSCAEDAQGGCGEEAADDCGSGLYRCANHRVGSAGPRDRAGALALAAVIAQHSPAVRAFDRRVTARLFRGNTRFGFTPDTKISVDADSVVCRVSNVDITS